MKEPQRFLKKSSKVWGKSHAGKGSLHEIAGVASLGQSSATAVMSLWGLSRDMLVVRQHPLQVLELGRCFFGAVDGLAWSLLSSFALTDHLITLRLHLGCQSMRASPVSRCWYFASNKAQEANILGREWRGVWGG